MEEIKGLKSQLANEFEIKDLGNLRYFFKIEVEWSMSGIVACQWRYILGLQEETGMIGFKPTEILIDPNHKLMFIIEEIMLTKENPRGCGRTALLILYKARYNYAVS